MPMTAASAGALPIVSSATSSATTATADAKRNDSMADDAGTGDECTGRRDGRRCECRSGRWVGSVSSWIGLVRVGIDCLVIQLLLSGG